MRTTDDFYVSGTTQLCDLCGQWALGMIAQLLDGPGSLAGDDSSQLAQARAYLEEARTTCTTQCGRQDEKTA